MKPLRHRAPSAVTLIVLLVLAIILMVYARQCSRPVSLGAQATEPGGDTLSIAIEMSPVSANVSADTLAGYYYDVIRAISRRENVAMAIYPVSITEGIEGLENGVYDLLVADIPATVASSHHLLLTEPLNLDRQVLVQRKNDMNYRSAFDLAGKEVYVPKDSPFVSRLYHLADEIGDTIYVIADPDYGQEALMMMVSAGEIPNAVVNRRQAETYSRRDSTIDFSVDISMNQNQAWAVAPGDTNLLKRFNNYITNFIQSEDAKKIASRHGLSNEK